MEKSPTSCKGKRLEWDGRFVHDGASKQELPQPPRLRTMNGSAVKSTFQHLGIQIKKIPAQKALTISPSLTSLASLRDKDKYQQECKKGGAYSRPNQIFPTHSTLQCETAGPHFDATSLSIMSLLTPTSDKSSEKSLRKNSYDSKNGESDDGLPDIVIDNSAPYEGMSKCRLSPLKIDVSSSAQTIDIDEIEMRKEIFNMANMDLSQSDADAKISEREDAYQSDITRSGAPNTLQPLCRLEVIGRGSSAIIYKAILLKSLSLCAEKVIVVADPSKRIQMMSELQTLKKTVRDRNGQNRCENIISLLDIVSNPREGTISICLEYLSGERLREHYLNPLIFLLCARTCFQTHLFSSYKILFPNSYSILAPKLPHFTPLHPISL